MFSWAMSSGPIKFQASMFAVLNKCVWSLMRSRVIILRATLSGSRSLKILGFDVYCSDVDGGCRVIQEGIAFTILLSSLRL